MCDSFTLLKDYAYLVYSEPKKEAVKTDKKFRDLVDCKNCNSSFCDYYLYPHQLQTLEALEKGKSVVLTASTGSGKTESWLLYFLRKGVRVLAIYPTKALANDQTFRLYKNLSCLGYNVYAKEEKGIYYGDLVRYDGDTSDKSEVIRSLPRSKIITTNPDMLILHLEYLTTLQPNLIVVDELDFYDMAKANALIEILLNSFSHSQFVIISGTLSNPDDLAKRLNNAEVIKGDAFKPEHRYFVVIGKRKELENVYYKHLNKLRAYQIFSFDDFVQKIFDVYYNATLLMDRELRTDIYDAFLKDDEEIEDLLSIYKSCNNELSIAFFPSILECEKFGKYLGIPTHHSKVDKKTRLLLEKRLREGVENYVFTVKTLLQGIDIGHAKRIIHLGLPFLVKDFLQREGRAGRRENIDFVESIIIPGGFDPRLRNGFETLKVWLSIGPEVVIYNPDSLYVKLWNAVLKMRDGKRLNEIEKNLASLVNLINERGEINYPRLRLFKFYEINSERNRIVIESGGRKEEVDRISMKDLIEFYQPGYVDLSNKTIVDHVEYNPRDRYFTVVERPVDEVTNECIKDGMDEYEAILTKWSKETGEYLPPNFELDLELGRILPKVLVDIHFKGEGFVKYREVPVRVRWYILSRKRLPSVKDGKLEYVYYSDKVDLNCNPTPRRGGHEDVTYAYAYEVKNVDVDAGMSFLLTGLRLFYGIRPDLINYSYFGDLLKVWETSPVGLLEKIREGGMVINGKKLDYDTFSSYLNNVNVDETFKVIFYSLYPMEGIDFEKARKDALTLAFKIFKRVKVFDKVVSSAVRNVILDRLRIKDDEYVAVVYPFLGGTKVEFLKNPKEKEVIMLLYDALELSDVILTTSYFPELGKLRVNVVNVKEEFKKKFNAEVDPADFSEDIVNLMLEISSEEQVEEEKIEKLFKLRAGIIQGIANYLSNV
ncbi:DEAD/DEAH box helicase [Sulfurisphaera javensis]|uniref:DEAD/DEAH box helicase n=1 Tax=Sulfurisphaera javensis TaxID=2049879 RepID=A0AAT9GVA1_9CREN